MQLEEILNLSTEDALIYLERRVNDIFPAEVADLYKPSGPNDCFDLPFVRLSKSKVDIYEANPGSKLKDAVFGREDTIAFFIHPEMLEHYKAKGMHDLLKCDGLISVCPTSSTRTVLTRGLNYNFMIKTDLFKRIGENFRSVRRKHVQFVNKIAQELETTDLPDYIAYLPESIGMIYEDNGTETGMLLRECQPRPLADNRRLIPFFALTSKDMLKPEQDLILKQILDNAHNQGHDKFDFFVEKILEPYINTWAYFAKEKGLFFELHPQNTLLEIDSKGIPIRIVIRDLQDFFIDADYRREIGLDADFGKNVMGQSNKIFKVNGDIIADSIKLKAIERSVSYDFRVSRTLDLFKATLNHYSICSETDLISAAKKASTKNFEYVKILPDKAYTISQNLDNGELVFAESKPIYR
jgi:hypothetical protein